jgi:hypothetical protein
MGLQASSARKANGIGSALVLVNGQAAGTAADTILHAVAGDGENDL